MLYSTFQYFHSLGSCKYEELDNLILIIRPIHIITQSFLTHRTDLLCLFCVSPLTFFCHTLVSDRYAAQYSALEKNGSFGP